MNKKYVIGIDNGVNGGITVLDVETKDIVYKTIMPVYGKTKKDYDLQTINNILKKYGQHFNGEIIAKVFLERAQPQFRDGKKQAFKTGYGFGAMEGLLAALLIPYSIIAPKVWQKDVFEGLNIDDTKISSILFCKRTWPNEDWTKSERSSKEHDGLTDSACIAYYGLKNGL